MLSDIHEGDTTRSLTGIGGSVSTSTVGTFSIFGEVSLCEGALANILCFADVAREFRITWKQREDCFVVHTPKGDLVFANVGKIYKANLLHLAHSSPPLLCNLNTVEENKAKYTKREVIRAEVARITITELRDATFHAMIRLSTSGEDVELDCRPSDAIAVAVRTGSPIYAADAVLDENAIEFEHEPEDDDDMVEKFKEFLDQVTPEDFAEGS